MRSWCPRTSSTRSMGVSGRGVCSIGPIRGAAGPARSTTTTAAAACTSRIRPGTTWKSSPGPTDRAAEPRHRRSGGPRVFQDDGNALPRPDAHTGGAVADVALAQLGSQRQHISGTTGPERMPDGHRAAVRGELLVGNRETTELIRQLAKHAKRLRTECLVHFPYVDLLGGQPGTLDRQG